MDRTIAFSKYPATCYACKLIVMRLRNLAVGRVKHLEFREIERETVLTLIKLRTKLSTDLQERVKFI